MLGLIKFKNWTIEELEARHTELGLTETTNWEELHEYEEIEEELFYRTHPIDLERLNFE
jgi:hypothetical protein